MGLDVSADHFYTSAMATAEFIASQCPDCTAYVIGEPSLTKAMYDQGIFMNDVNPEYVVLGETRTYCFEKVEKAIELVNKGAKLVGCNPDTIGILERGVIPATGSLIATGKKAYFVGKPNPLIVRNARRRLGLHSSDIAFIGDRMDTDVIAGIDSVLVLSGVSTMDSINDFPYRPKYILGGICDLVKDL